MVVLWIALGVAAIWVTFLFAPSFILYRLVFSRKPTAPPTADSLAETVLAPYSERILEDMAFLDALSPERVTVTAKDGAPLVGYYWRRGADKTVILFHGYNTHPAKNFAVHARLFRERGYDVLAVHERGHGESGGAHNGMGLLERYDVPLWVEKARELSPSSRVVLYGTSMGAATVAYASASLDPRSVGAIVIDCGFVSPYEQLRTDASRRRLPPALLMPLISLHARVFLGIRLRERTSDALAKCKIPAFFIHGENDLTVNVDRGRENFNACASEKELLTVPEAAHTTALIAGGEEAQRKLFDFVEKRLGETPGER